MATKVATLVSRRSSYESCVWDSVSFAVICDGFGTGLSTVAMRPRLALIPPGFFPPFTADEVDRARRYHGPIYLSFAVGVALGLATLAALSAFATWRVGPWWLAAPLFAAACVSLSAVVRLPVTVWRGWVHERRWGFSTQSPSGFAADFLKKVLAACVFAAIPVTAVVGLSRAFPSWWVALAAPGAALLVLLVGFAAPVVLEPLFNRFT